MAVQRLVAFIFAAALTGSMAQAEIKTEWIEYTHGDVKLKGYLVYDDASSASGRPCWSFMRAKA